MYNIKNKYRYIFVIFVILLFFIAYNNIDNFREKFNNNNNNNNNINNNKITINNSNNKKTLKYIDLLNIYNEGKYKNIIDSLEKKINNEILLDKEKKLLINAYLNYGNYFYKEGKYSKKAIRLINTIKNNNTDYQLLGQYGYALEIIRNYKGALQKYNIALELGSNDLIFKAYIIRQIGHIYALKGDFNNSKKYYEIAYNLNPNDPVINLSMGSLYTRLLKYEKGISFFNKALKLTDNNYLKSEINYNLSSLIFYIKNKTYKEKLKESLKYAKNSVILNNNYPFGYFGVARVLMEYGKYNESEKNIKKGLELYPNSNDGYKFYGILEMQKGNFINSNKYFNKAILLIDNDITLMGYEKKFRLGEIYYFKSINYSMNNDLENTLKNILELIKTGNNQFIFKLIYEFKSTNYGVYSKFKDTTKFKIFVKNLETILKI